MTEEQAKEKKEAVSKKEQRMMIESMQRFRRNGYNLKRWMAANGYSMPKKDYQFDEKMSGKELKKAKREADIQYNKDLNQYKTAMQSALPKLKEYWRLSAIAPEDLDA